MQLRYDDFNAYVDEGNEISKYAMEDITERPQGGLRMPENVLLSRASMVLQEITCAAGWQPQWPDHLVGKDVRARYSNCRSSGVRLDQLL